MHSIDIIMITYSISSSNKKCYQLKNVILRKDLSYESNIHDNDILTVTYINIILYT